MAYVCAKALSLFLCINRKMADKGVQRLLHVSLITWFTNMAVGRIYSLLTTTRLACTLWFQHSYTTLFLSNKNHLSSRNITLLLTWSNGAIFESLTPLRYRLKSATLSFLWKTCCGFTSWRCCFNWNNIRNVSKM